MIVWQLLAFDIPFIKIPAQEFPDLPGQRIIDHNFKPGFKIRLHRKDMKIALQAGKELSVPLPCSEVVAAQMDKILEEGRGELDHSALALYLENISGL